VTVLGSKATPHTQATPEEMKAYENEIIKGIAGDTIRIIQKPDLAQVHGQLQEIHAKGIRSLAICFLHAFTYPEHELQVKKVAEEIGFAHIHVSGPIQRIVPRAHSTVADAYLTPKLQEYTENFLSGFDLSRDKDFPSRILFMRSDGGLCMLSEAAGAEAVVSGPAGGVVGYSSTAWDPDSKTPLIGFDMGGTSTGMSSLPHGPHDAD
jgi:5-oxoprolinase (ATP-hydrolysing)